MRGWAAGCEVFSEHGAGSIEHEDKQSRRCRAPMLGVAVISLVGLIGTSMAQEERETPPSCASGLEGKHSGW